MAPPSDDRPAVTVSSATGMDTFSLQGVDASVVRMMQSAPTGMLLDNGTEWLAPLQNLGHTSNTAVVPSATGKAQQPALLIVSRRA